ncbi:Precorrin-6Y C(5,15)-methyltransferase [decarboxylating] [Sinobacterium norvegicum]|uniref:Precorrin-6Y C(5,15)-methyltransferase [decarboxylating] n=1 Tax=Sinobacterium norvegicum TaxID=1641715 RepID=A0ABM9AJG5_9GAMM|nr:precorrin-6y C5,15-methyltransferase (decarboxylating) subunit CbiE [Sinobacterium norvegicum]CAH0993381.1 Precorrin-6Y C(5,15)-methyltransferase [decarboxylating] [Sinobacterium norvegicum]
MNIDVIGLGVSAEAVLDRRAAEAVQRGQIIVGSPRQLATVERYLSAENQVQRVELPKLAELKQAIVQWRQQGVSQLVVLASGDPLFYGIGRWLGQNSAGGHVCFHPGVSSIQAACHQLGLSLQDVDVISLHGRPLMLLRRHLKAFQHLLILTDKHSQPRQLAEQCHLLGFGDASITVCEQLGYPEQRLREFSVEQLLADNTLAFDLLHVSVIQTQQNRGYLPAFPGIEDQHYITDADKGKGLLTKRQVRLSILSLLAPTNGDRLWDIGAGCGGVAIELARWAPRASVLAVEHHPVRFECLQQNQQRFGVVDNLQLLNQRAPQCLEAQTEAANKVFIGGSDGELNNLLLMVWQQLPVDGVIVVSAVTENTKIKILQFIEQQLPKIDQSCHWQSVQVAVSQGDVLASQLLYRPNLPVTLFKMVKTQGQL